MYRFLLSRRWLGLLAAVLVAATACVLLGMWQLDRLQGRHARNDLLRDNLTVAPAPVDRLLDPSRPVRERDQWRRVRATGRYDTHRQLLVRNRPLDGAVGYHVLTPLVTDEGTALLVDRGWVPAGASASDVPDVPPVPAGDVVLTARVRPSEPAAGGDPAPAGQVRRIDLPGITATLPYPVYGAYAELVSQQPAPDLGGGTMRLLPPPEPSEGPHLAYAVQWFMFAIIALGGYVVLARREAQEATRVTPDRVPAQRIPG